MSAPSKVRELVDLFHRNANAYHAPQYNEAMVRQEFINPLFKSLGWDMDNEQGYAEAYKDVIHEAAINIGGATKTPQEQTVLQRQIDATDRQIDQLVYSLYGLTDAEIQIVEAANA